MSNWDKWHTIAAALAVGGFLGTLGLLLHFKQDLSTAAPSVAILAGVVVAAFAKQLGGKDANSAQAPGDAPK